MISIIFLLFSLPSLVLSHPFLSVEKIDLPLNTVGPFSVAFDRLGRGPFTGLSDGRVMRYDTIQKRFIDFAFTANNRTKAMCDGTNTNNNPTLGAICGRPLGVVFYFRTNQAYVTDAYQGFLLVEPIGRLAARIATGAEGEPFKLPFHLDVDQLIGDVYFTDFSSQFPINKFQLAIDANDSTGRLLKYSRSSGEVNVLLRNLSGAGGVVISHDRRYLLVSEYIANRIKKFWLSGPYAFTSTDLITFEGRPMNIKRNNVLTDYWTVQNTRRPGPNGTVIGIPSAVRFSGFGKILETVDLSGYYQNTTVSEFQPAPGIGTAYVGSTKSDYLLRLN